MATTLKSNSKYIAHTGPGRAREKWAEKPMFLALFPHCASPAHLFSNSMNSEMSGMKGMDEVIGPLDRDLPKDREEVSLSETLQLLTCNRYL